MQGPRDQLVAQRLDHLDQPGYAGRPVEVADVGLDRSEHAVLLRLGRAEGAGQGGDLHRVADLGRGAVGLHVGDGRRVHPRLLDGPGDAPALAVDARRQIAELHRAVVVDVGGADDGEHGVPVGQRAVEALEHDDGGAVAEHASLALGVEGAHVAVGRLLAALLPQVADPVRDADRHATGQGHVALVAAQALAGEVHGDQRGRAEGLHRDARAREVEPEGHVRGERVLVVADHQRGRVDAHVERLEAGQQVGADVHSREHADAAPVARRGVAGGLEDLPHALQEDALLRVGEGGLAGVVAEEPGVEPADVVEDRAASDVVRLLEGRRVDARER